MKPIKCLFIKCSLELSYIHYIFRSRDIWFHTSYYPCINDMGIIVIILVENTTTKLKLNHKMNKRIGQNFRLFFWCIQTVLSRVQSRLSCWKIIKSKFNKVFFQEIFLLDIGVDD